MKYWLQFKTYLQNTLSYPVSFWLWRLRQFLATFTSLTVWTIIFQNKSVVFNYTQSQMVSYILLIGFLQSIILATQLTSLATKIYNGEISNLFLKPVNVFASLITDDLADKLYNFFFTILETFILFQIFHPQVVWPQPLQLALFLVATALGAVLLFFIMLLFGTMGFWTPDTWGVRFLFYMFVDFTAGKLYPLNILPSIVQKIIFFTPFPYFSYVQSQIFLGNFQVAESVKSIGVLIGWVLVCGFLFKYVWQKGLKEFGALGR